MERFNRNYRLLIRFSETDVLEILPPLRIQFEGTKTIQTDINELKIKIFNLSQNNRAKLIKDKSLRNEDTYLQIAFQVGYGDDLNDVYVGNIQEAGSVKSGADWITTIYSRDGGVDFQNAFTSTTITKDVNPFVALLRDTKYLKRGKIPTTVNRVRPRVFVGATLDLFQQSVAEDQIFFIDNERINVIGDKELIDSQIVEVSADTGLLNAPLKQNSFVTCETLLNPAIKCGSRVRLISLTETLNDLYVVRTIQFTGDNRGEDWKQTLTMLRAEGFNVAN